MIDLTLAQTIDFDTGDVTIGTAWTSLGILNLGGFKTGLLLNLNNDGAAALTHFKLTRAARAGGNHQDWMVDTDFNTATAEIPSVVDGASPPNIHQLANSAQGQIKLDRQQGVYELQAWAKSAGTTLRITGTAH